MAEVEITTSGALTVDVPYVDVTPALTLGGLALATRIAADFSVGSPRVAFVNALGSFGFELYEYTGREPLGSPAETVRVIRLAQRGVCREPSRVTSAHRIIVLALLGGCGSPAPRGTPPAPTPEPEVRRVEPPRAEGRAVVTLSTARGALRLVDVTEPTRSAIVVERGAERYALRWDTSTPIQGWQAARLEPDGRAVVAVVDSVVEAPGAELEVLVSPDAGGRWERRTPIRKPSYLATFAALELIAAGHYRVTVRLEDCAGCGEEPGLYTYESTDGGRRWSPPAFRPLAGLVANELAGPESLYPPERAVVLEAERRAVFYYRSSEPTGHSGWRRGDRVRVWSGGRASWHAIAELRCDACCDGYTCSAFLDAPASVPGVAMAECDPTVCPGGSCRDGVCVGTTTCEPAMALMPPTDAAINDWAAHPVPSDMPGVSYDLDSDGCTDVVIRAARDDDGWFWTLIERDLTHPDRWWVSQSVDLI